MAHKVKALQQWCKLRCEGYRDVEITNFTSSWKSGLAFCAIIHRYRPDLIDYDSLKKEDTFGNSKLAFDVALKELKIAALLDPEDMVIMTVPDKLCIVTYVAQYYNYFHDKPQLGGPGVKSTGAPKRPLSIIEQPKKNLGEITNKVTPADKQISPAAKRRTIEDRCCMCHEKVYLLERHYEGGKLYHRHCCREAERSSTLKRNKENFGDKKESFIGGYQSKVADNKYQDTSTEATKKPTSTGVIKSLFVPSKYKSDTNETSKVPATSNSQISATNKGPTFGLSTAKTTSAFSGFTPGAVTVTASSRVSPVVPATTFSAQTTRSNPFNTTNTTNAATPTYSSSKFLTPTAQTSTPKYSSGTSITPTTATTKALLSPTSRFTPSTTSSAVTSSSSTSKFPSIFSSRTTAPGKSSPVTTTGYVSTVTTTVSGSKSSGPSKLTDMKITSATSSGGQIPTFQLNSGDITFKFDTPSSGNSANKGIGSGISGSKSPTPFSPTNKGPMEGPKTGKTEGKTEWQLEAEKRAAARNGTYVDPEKNPTAGRKPGGITPAGQKDDEKNITEIHLNIRKDESPFSKDDTARSSAKDNLVKILHHQLHPKKDQIVVSVPTIEVPNDAQVGKGDESWVIVEHKDALPLSPQENLKKFMEERNVGFTNDDRIPEAAKHRFEDSPPTLKKQKQKIEDPLVPKRKVNAEERVSVEQINNKLVSLDEKLRVIESKGRVLEDKIRGGTDEAMDEDEGELMYNWFDLVKQKYELVREESELIYKKRQQELEEFHEELEYQYRCLASKPDDEKTYSEKRDEEELLREILATVDKRDSIVNSMEVDRQKYLEEDEQIANMMKETGISDSGKSKKKQKKKKKNNYQYTEKGSTRKWNSFLRKSPKATAAVKE